MRWIIRRRVVSAEKSFKTESEHMEDVYFFEQTRRRRRRRRRRFLKRGAQERGAFVHSLASFTHRIREHKQRFVQSFIVRRRTPRRREIQTNDPHVTLLSLSLGFLSVVSIARHRRCKVSQTIHRKCEHKRYGSGVYQYHVVVYLEIHDIFFQ